MLLPPQTGDKPIFNHSVENTQSGMAHLGSSLYYSAKSCYNEAELFMKIKGFICIIKIQEGGYEYEQTGN